MIRKLQTKDIDTVAEIWLDTNQTAHDFIPPQYWQNHFAAVKEMLSQAEIYLCEHEETHQIQGFIGLEDSYIAGLFVRTGEQSRGIGKQLLDFVKGIKTELTLCVYQKNARAVKFYRRENFQISSEQTDRNTGEPEYFMHWKKSVPSSVGYEAGQNDKWQ